MSGPRGLPLLGSLIPFARDPLAFLTENTQRYGRSFRFSVGPMRFQMLGTPEALREVLVERADRYRKGPGYDGMRVVLRSGSFVAEGPQWRERRTAIQPLFRPERLSEQLPAIAGAVDDAVAELSPGRLDPQAVATTMAMDVVGRLLFGASLRALGEPMRVAIDDCIHFAYTYGNEPLHPPLWLPTPGRLRYRRAITSIRGRLERILQSEGPLQGALAGRPAGEVADEMLVQLAAGSETTAAVLSFAVSLAASDPECVANIRAEASRLSEIPTPQQLKEMPYTTSVWLETLRLYPPIWFLERQALEDDTVDGIAMPAGSIAVICPYVLQRDPSLWPEPDTFVPTRFLSGVPSGSDRFRWLPYGLGPRTCAGAALATIEAKLFLARLFQRFDIPPTPIPSPLARLTLRPPRGFQLALGERDP